MRYSRQRVQVQLVSDVGPSSLLRPVTFNRKACLAWEVRQVSIRAMAALYVALGGCGGRSALETADASGAIAETGPSDTETSPASDGDIDVACGRLLDGSPACSVPACAAGDTPAVVERILRCVLARCSGKPYCYAIDISVDAGCADTHFPIPSLTSTAEANCMLAAVRSARWACLRNGSLSLRAYAPPC